MKYCALIIIAIVILLAACDIKNPALPSWDVDLHIPLINQQFYPSDLVDNVNIVTDDNQILTITSNGSAETPEFGPVPFNPNSHMENIPIPGTGENLFIPFIDNEGIVEISYAEVSSGLMRSKFTEVNSSVQELKLVFHNLFQANGEEFVINWTGEADWVNTSLAGLHIGTLDSGQIISELPVSLVVTPALPQGTTAARFGFEANSVLNFPRFQGQLNNYELELTSSMGTVDISYPYGINEAVELQEASLRVTLTNYIGFAAKFSGRIKAENEAGEVRFVDIVDDNGDFYYTIPAVGNSPGISVLDFHNNISQLLQIMPTELKMVDALLTISNGQGIGHVEIDDKVIADYTVNAPMSFILHEHDIVIQDEQEISIPESNREQIRDNALSASLSLLIKNTLPLGASANLYFSDSPNIDVTDPATYDFVENTHIHSAATEPGWQTLELTLTKPELDVFTQPSVYLRWSFSFESSDGETVTIYARTTDYIHVKGMMIANLLIEEPEK